MKEDADWAEMFATEIGFQNCKNQLGKKLESISRAGIAFK